MAISVIFLVQFPKLLLLFLIKLTYLDLTFKILSVMAMFKVSALGSEVVYETKSHFFLFFSRLPL